MAFRDISKAATQGSLNNMAWDYLLNSVDLSLTAWNTQAVHEVFTVTGLVRVQLLVSCSETLVDAADGASIQFGFEGATTALIASTGAAGAGGNTVAINELWIDNSPADTYATFANAVFNYIVYGLDIGYEITGAALTNGTLDFHCWWEPISNDGN